MELWEATMPAWLAGIKHCQVGVLADAEGTEELEDGIKEGIYICLKVLVVSTSR